MEVNLAIFIMAVGLLAMVALYPLAYRENQQSKDDVKAAAAADCILNTLTAALSSRSIKWEDWQKEIKSATETTEKGKYKNGWLAYCDWEGTSKDGAFVPKGKTDINDLAADVFNALVKCVKEQGKRPNWPFNRNDLACAIVARWGQMPVYNSSQARMEMKEDYSRVAIGVRVARRSGDLMSQPLFYTEIHFQGDQKDLKE